MGWTTGVPDSQPQNPAPIVSNDPPLNPTPNQLWFCVEERALYTSHVNPGDGHGQWVGLTAPLRSDGIAAR
jgi:hypothetical protein